MRHPSLVLTPLALLIACGGSGEPTQTKRDAQEGWRKTEVALGAAGLQTGWSGSGMVSEDGASGVVTGLVDCPDGGTLGIEAVGEATNSAASGSLDLEFNGCQVDDVIIDGRLEYDGRVEPNHVIGQISGDLDWSGALEGHCSIDIRAEVTLDGASGRAEVSGGLCGHDWSEVY